MRMAVLTWIVAIALVVCVACDLTEPYPPPKDPGTVTASVTDASGTPVRGVWVYVHDVPNHVGTTYSVGAPTDASGKISIQGITAGTRRVEVKPPAGYGTAEPIKTVEVVKGKSVDVAFVLTRNAV
jgi:hypothetical protein